MCLVCPCSTIFGDFDLSQCLCFAENTIVTAESISALIQSSQARHLPIISESRTARASFERSTGVRHHWSVMTYLNDGHPRPCHSSVLQSRLIPQLSTAMEKVQHPY